jgi:hypothetical protein
MVGSDVFIQINTTVSNLTQTGNSLSGNFTSVDNPVLTTNVTQTGDDASGSFTLIENSHDNPTVTTTGNTISGQQTILTTNGSQTYNFTQTQSGYTLTGGGTKTYSSTETDSVTTGVASSTETGTDSYTLGESGSAVDTQSLTGSDGYTTTRTQNSLDGSFSIVTTGTGSNSYTVTQTGNTFAATVSLSKTGTTRYDQLQAYDNTADSASGGVGMADFSPVGLPVLVGRASVTAGTFSQIGNAQFEYCFAQGTRVVMADLTRKAIETITENEQVQAVLDKDPMGKPRACRVKAVYHNDPAAIWHVHAAGQTIRTTIEHPFFVDGRGWTKVRDLLPGDRLRTDGGERVRVESVEDSGNIEPVYNLQVEDCHTYFVSASATDVAVLVHNASTPDELDDDVKIPSDPNSVNDLGAAQSFAEEAKNRAAYYWNQAQDTSSMRDDFDHAPEGNLLSSADQYVRQQQKGLMTEHDRWYKVAQQWEKRAADLQAGNSAVQAFVNGNTHAAYGPYVPPNATVQAPGAVNGSVRIDNYTISRPRTNGVYDAFQAGAIGKGGPGNKDVGDVDPSMPDKTREGVRLRAGTSRKPLNAGAAKNNVADARGNAAQMGAETGANVLNQVLNAPSQATVVCWTLKSDPQVHGFYVVGQTREVGCQMIKEWTHTNDDPYKRPHTLSNE